MTPVPHRVAGEAALARLGQKLREAQKADSDKRRRHKAAECVAEAAKAAELQQQFDALCRQAPDSPLARLGALMRDAQKAHAQKLRQCAESLCVAERARAYALQSRFEAACREVLEGEQPLLPGMEGGEVQ
jgi:hypothetical protein